MGRMKETQGEKRNEKRRDRKEILGKREVEIIGGRKGERKETGWKRDKREM